MFRPHFNTYHNPRYGQWSSHLTPQGNSVPYNIKVNRYRSSGPLILQNNYKFWCETCDKGFNTLQILENHKSQHQKCNIDGCQFVAHPKIITKHIQMQHSTGLYKKIANLNNPEQLKKWREERKRKYPTKQNIENKAAELKEKLERGEKLGLFDNHKKRYKPESHSTLKSNFIKCKHHGRQNNRQLGNKNIHKKPFSKILTAPPITENFKLNPFAGILHLQIDDNIDDEYNKSNEESLIEDDVINEDIMNLPKSEKPSVCGALSSLICNYGSSDEDVFENPTVIKPNNLSLNFKPQCNKEELLEETNIGNSILLSINNNDKNDDDSGPEEAVISKTDTENINMKDETKIFRPKIEKRVKIGYTNTKQIKRPKYQLPSTLLVKLLNREIEQERNIILQCVRYVVKNDYFDNLNN